MKNLNLDVTSKSQGLSPPGPTILILCSRNFNALAQNLANQTPRFANRCLRFALNQLAHRLLGEPFSIGGSSVALHLS